MNSKFVQASLSCACAAAFVVSGHAAIVDQTVTNPAAGVDWNQATVWGGNTVVPADTYNMVAGPTQIGQSYTAGGKAWTYFGQLRDSTTTSVFAGGQLLINDATRLLVKAIDSLEATSTADIVLNGGHIISAPNNGGTVTLAGTIDLAAPLGAIGMNPAGGSTVVFNIDSTITGSGTLQLVQAGGADRIASLNVRGDISNFAGEFYVTTSEGIPSGPGSIFSFASAVAPLATLNLAVFQTNFLFDLNSDLVFGSVIIGGAVLDPGTYDFAYFDFNYPGLFKDNGGSITVGAIPEPSTIGLIAVASLGLLVLGRRLKAASIH